MAGLPRSPVEFRIGDSARLSRSFSAADVRAFAGLTGDSNPIHLDEDAARRTRFQKPIVHGMLYAGLVSAVLGSKLPGPGTIYLSQSLKFLAPVGIDETVTAEVIVTAWRPDKRILTLRTRCFTADGLDVIEGEAVVLVEPAFGATP